MAEEANSLLLLTFGRRLREIREMRGYSLRKMAIACGHCNGSKKIRDIEAGKHNIQVMTLDRMLRMLDVTWEEFILWDGKRP